MIESFNAIEDIDDGINCALYLDRSHVEVIGRGGTFVNLDVADARVLRDWLNRALPDSAGESQ